MYAANTLGAAAGAVLAGFVLIPALGLSGTTFVGVALNVIAAGGAWVIARARRVVRSGRRQPRPPSTATSATESRKHGHEVPSPKLPSPDAASRPWLAAAALGVSGFASLTLQVVWTRLLVQILGPTTYAFSTVVSIFIIGIAGGAAIGSRAGVARDATRRSASRVPC